MSHTTALHFPVVRFVNRVGNFAAYPYFRSHFAEITSQAGITIPPLPVMKEGKWPISKEATEAKARKRV